MVPAIKTAQSKDGSKGRSKDKYRNNAGPVLLHDRRAPLTRANLQTLLEHMAVQAGADQDPCGTDRDRLFEALMARFDGMQAQRAAYINVIDRLVLTPPLWPALARLAGAQAAALLGDLRLLVGDRRRHAQIAGLLLCVSATLRVWRQDDSPDLSATMRALDRNLAWADKGAAWLGLGVGGGL